MKTYPFETRGRHFEIEVDPEVSPGSIGWTARAFEITSQGRQPVTHLDDLVAGTEDGAAHRMMNALEQWCEKGQ